VINTVHNVFKDKKFFTHFAYGTFRIIACGNNVKKNLTDFFKINEKQITTIHNAVEAPNLDPSDNISLLTSLRSQGNYLVGNIGRLSEQKGISYFIKAMPILKGLKIKIKFIIVGDGEEFNELSQLVAKLNLTQDIFFLGYRSNVANIMRQLDVIVLSSLWEGLPLTPMEAFAVSKTVIGTNIGGTNEIIQDNKNGLLVKERDPEDIAKKIVYLYNNPEKKHWLEKNAFQTFKEEFEFPIFANKVMEYYRHV